MFNVAATNTIQLVSSVGQNSPFFCSFHLLSIENVFRICTDLDMIKFRSENYLSNRKYKWNKQFIWYANTIKSIILIFLSLALRRDHPQQQQQNVAGMRFYVSAPMTFYNSTKLSICWKISINWDRQQKC